jgi:hypothetical protein
MTRRGIELGLDQRVETVLGAKVGDARVGADASAGNDDDFACFE